MRRAIIGGNWKMNLGITEGTELARKIVESVGAEPPCDVVLIPPFTHLSAVSAAVAGSPVEVGAQNVHWEAAGAFTGEVSIAMLREAGCTWVVIGHSERRQLFGELDPGLNLKVSSALSGGLGVILCVGETREEREAGATEGVVLSQLERCLAGIEPAALNNLVLAYEPVWAIGTGLTATPEQAQEVHARIRRWWSERYGSSAAEVLRIQYGGSVKPSNASELLRQPDIDGGLIGGASLDASSFVGIIDATRSA